MACRAPEYHGGDESDVQWQNWARLVNRTITRYLTPTTLPELVRVVGETTDDNAELHALGSGWAFEDLGISTDRTLDLRRINENDSSPLPDVVGQGLTDEWRARHDDPDGQARLFHVHAGLEVGEVCDRLAALDPPLALRTLGGANGQSLVGAFSTSTHGGDIREAPLPDQIRAIHMVAVDGQELWIEPQSAPITRDDRLRPLLACPDLRIVRDDEIFNAALVSAGRFGVIYSVVVHARPAFKLAEWTTRLPRAAVLSALSAGVDASTGLTPLEGLLPAPPDDLQADTSGGMHFFQLVFNSQDPGTCLIQGRWPTDGDDLFPRLPANPLCSTTGVDAILNAGIIALHAEAFNLVLIPLVGIGWSLECLRDAASLEVLRGSGLTTGQALAVTVNLAWKWKLGFLVPHVAQRAIDGRFEVSERVGRRGPGWLLTSGTREESHSDCYTADSIEVIFPADTQNYLRFLGQILDAAPGFHQCGYVSVRYSAPSQALMSMHNLPADMVLSIEVATIGGLEGNAAWMAYTEQAALAEDGRPHWGQENKLTEGQVARLYGNNLVRWREALLAHTGTSTLFSNAYTRQRGLEPNGILRHVTRTRKNPDGDITHLCGADDARWGPVPVAEAIEQIRSGAVVYITSVNGTNAFVHVIDDPDGPYLRTDPDATVANNLDELPDC